MPRVALHPASGFVQRAARNDPARPLSIPTIFPQLFCPLVIHFPKVDAASKPSIFREGSRAPPTPTPSPLPKNSRTPKIPPSFSSSQACDK